MRIVLFKVGKESSVRQVLEPGCVVPHSVRVAREETGEVAVSVQALVVTGFAAQGGRGVVRRDGSFTHSRDCRDVVAQVFHGGIADVMRGGHQVDLSEQSGVFQVAVRDVPIRVGERH